MIAGAVCMSHSPLMDRNRAEPAQESAWNEALGDAARFIKTRNVDFCIVFYPDHLNGFLYDLMPSFCVGASGTSLGDFGTIPGALDIPENLAASCAAHCISSGVDVAISYDMEVDHGGVQPLEMLSIGQDLTRFIPIFINCVAPPRPIFPRVRALGEAVGNWARGRHERVMMIGSGGLSHDPPLPSISSATGDAGKRLREGGPLSHRDRLVRQRNVVNEGILFSDGHSRLRPLSPTWDEGFIRAMAGGDLCFLDQMAEEAITAEAGTGAHELRCWIAALSAIGGYTAGESFYAPVEPWITGMGLMTATPFGAARQLTD